MADNLTFTTTVATAPNGTVVRTKDRSGIESQIVGLDLNPGGSTEILMKSTRTDGLMPAAIDDLSMAIRDTLKVIANPPSRDAFDRVQVFINGGVCAISSMTGVTLSTVTTLGTITNPVYQALPGGGLLQFPVQQPISQVAWGINTRSRIN